MVANAGDFQSAFWASYRVVSGIQMSEGYFGFIEGTELTLGRIKESIWAIGRYSSMSVHLSVCLSVYEV